MYQGYNQQPTYGQPGGMGFQGGVGVGGFGFQGGFGQPGFQGGQFQQPMGGYQGYQQQPMGGYEQQPMGGYQGYQQQPMGGYQGYQQQQMGGYQQQSMGGYQQPIGGYQQQPMGGYQQQPMGGYQQQPMGGYQQKPMGGYQQQQSMNQPRQIPLPMGQPMGHPLQQNLAQPISPMGMVTNFNPEKDCDMLRKAMKGLGTDEDTIIKIVCNRTAMQRKEIKKYYSSAYGKDLIKQLKSELSGRFEDVVLGLFETPIDYDAICLYKAMKGLGTDEDTLIEIIGTRNNYQINEVKKAFNRIYGKDLIKWVQSETSGSFRKLLVSLLQGNRSENQMPDQNMCMNDANALYKAGVGRWGTDEATFNKIFALRSRSELQMISQCYEKLTGKTLLKSIDSEFSGDIKKLLKTVVLGLFCPSEYFATRVHDAVAGLGTKDKQLIRVLITRDEVDMPQIKAEYQRLYGRDMMGDIRSDTSGDYRKILNELAGH